MKQNWNKMDLILLLVFLEVNSVNPQKGWDLLVKEILNQEVMVGWEHRCTKQRKPCPEEP